MRFNTHSNKKHHHRLEAVRLLHDIGRRMAGGEPVSAKEHKRAVTMHAEAHAMPHLFLCVQGHTFEPRPSHEADYVILHCSAVVLPADESGVPPIVYPEQDPTNPNARLVIEIAVCAEHSGPFVKYLEMDWSEHDEQGKPIGQVQTSAPKRRKRTKEE
jgi:hypothetical protein